VFHLSTAHNDVHHATRRESHLYLVTAPAVEPVTLEEVKTHARIDYPDHDEQLTSLIKVAREKLDGRDGVLNRALVQQTWDWKLRCFFDRTIDLPMPPLRSIVSVKYLDTARVLQTLSPSLYQVFGADRWGPAELRPASASSWPLIGDDPEAVTIRLICGYPPSSAEPPDYRVNVPETVKLAINIMVAAWYENREAPGVIPDSVGELLAGYRVDWF